MGILDSVLGSVLGGGNRAQGQPIGSGMSPMMKALMLALAAKAYHDYRSRGAGPSGPIPSGPGPDPSMGGGGGLGGGWLRVPRGVDDATAPDGRGDAAGHLVGDPGSVRAAAQGPPPLVRLASPGPRP